MDLSNRESAEYWHKRAEEVSDPDLRKEALKTHRKFLKMAMDEERMRLRLQNPGFGVRSMFGWIVIVALMVLVAILSLSKIFSVATVCSVFALALVLCVIAAAVTLRVHGHVSEDSMLAMIQHALKMVPVVNAKTPVIEATREVGKSVSTITQRLSAGVPIASLGKNDLLVTPTIVASDDETLNDIGVQ